MPLVATDLPFSSLHPALMERGLEAVGLGEARSAAADVLLLGWDPESRGAGSLLYEVREQGWHGPVMLMAPGEDSGAVARALDDGAADAVDRRAQPEEVAARLAAIIRCGSASIIDLGDLRINQLTRQVSRSERPIALMPREYALLLHLAQNAGAYFSRSALLTQVWGLAFDPGTNVVEVHVSRLRAKVDRGFDRPLILSERGRGYCLAAA